jgi:hypothetical protein
MRPQRHLVAADVQNLSRDVSGAIAREKRDDRRDRLGGAAACARRPSGSRSVMRVSAVGEMQFTVTPYLAIASAVERVKPTIPSLAAE